MRNSGIAISAAITLFPALALAQAGVVLMSVGDVQAQRGAQVLPLPVGAAIQPGDTIRVGASSNAQVRLTDASIIALRQGTAFRIDEYSFSGKGDAGDKSIFSLLKGGMRTITGAIGRLQRRDAYAVRTPTSTIGIRGTHYTLVQCDNDCGATGSAAVQLAQAGGTMNDAGPLAQAGGAGGGIQNGTYGGVTDGRISVGNQTGEREFGHDEFFFVASQNTPPQSLLAPPTFLYDRLAGQARNQGQQGGQTGTQLAGSGINAESRPNDVPTPPAPPAFVVTEQRNSSGNLTVVATIPTLGGLGSWLDVDGTQGTGGAFFPSGFNPVVENGGTFSLPPGTCTGPNGGGCPAGFTVNLPAPTAGTTGMLDVGGSVPIAWGRWDSGTITSDTGTLTITSTNPAHFMAGPLTPPDVIAAKTGQVLYQSSFPGMGTMPINNLGQGAISGTFPTITMDFTARTATFSTSSVNFLTQNWTISGGVANIVIVPGQGAFFGGQQGADFPGTSAAGTCSGAGCNSYPGVSTPISVKAAGIFYGPAGNYAGVAFGALARPTTIAGSLPPVYFNTVRVYCPSGC